MNQNNKSSRGEQTKQKLLNAALEVFSENGYDGVRTRTIANRAEVNLSAIPYYFGGKEGLYIAVAKQIAHGFGTELVSLAKNYVNEIKINKSKMEAVKLVQNLFYQLSKKMIGTSQESSISIFIAREQLQPTSAFDTLYQDIFEPLHKSICDIIYYLKPEVGSCSKNIQQAHALIGMMLSFIFAKHVFLRRENIEDYSSNYVEEISKTIGEIASNYILN